MPNKCQFPHFREHAQTTGRLAGANMTGAERTYEHQAGFVSLVSPNVHIR